MNTKSSIYRQALELSWLAIIFLIPLFFYPESNWVFTLTKILLFQFLVILMLGLLVADWIHNPNNYQNFHWRRITGSPLHFWILIFALVAIIATTASINPTVSFWGRWGRNSGLLTILSEVVFFLIVSQQMRSRSQLFRALYVLMASSAIFAIIGILQNFFPDTFYYDLFHVHARESRVFSSAGNPLTLSSFLSLVIPLTMALVANAWKHRKDSRGSLILITLSILFVIQFWCLVLGQYSITILVFIVSPILFLIVLGLTLQKRAVLTFGLICIASLIVLAAILVIPLLFSEGSSENGQVEAEAKSSDLVVSAEELNINTLSERIGYWHSATNVIFKSPGEPYVSESMQIPRTLIGYGPETFVATSQAFYPEEQKTHATEVTKFADRPHNHYLYLGATMGLIGLGTFLAILIIFSYLSTQLFRGTMHSGDKLILIGLIASVGEYAVNSIFNISELVPGIVFWLTLALLPVIGRLNLHGNFEHPDFMQEKKREQLPHRSFAYPKLRKGVAVLCVISMVVVGILITNGPLRADIEFANARSLSAKGSPDTLAAFSKAADLNPNEANYWGAKGAYARAIAFQSTDEDQRTLALEVSTDSFEKARETEPYMAFWYYSLADTYTYWAYHGAPDKLDRALSLYDKADQLFPENAIILDKWARALIVADNYDLAGEKLDDALDTDPDWQETYFLSALLSAAEGNGDEAGTKLVLLIQNDPAGLIDFEYFCGKTAAMLNILSPLHEALDNYVQIVPNEWIPHALLGTTSFLSAESKQSVEQFDTAMGLVPDENVSDLFKAILSLSRKSSSFTAMLAEVAPGWEEKISRSEQSIELLTALDGLIITSGSPTANSQ